KKLNMKTRLTSCAAPQRKWRRKGTLWDVGSADFPYVFSAVPGSAGILACAECWLLASLARTPALPGTGIHTHALPVCGATDPAAGRRVFPRLEPFPFPACCEVAPSHGWFPRAGSAGRADFCDRLFRWATLAAQPAVPASPEPCTPAGGSVIGRGFSLPQ